MHRAIKRIKNPFKTHIHHPIILHDHPHSWIHKQGHQKKKHHYQFNYAAANLKFSHYNLLQRVDESAVVNWGRVDNFLNELSVTVGVGCGDVNKDLQVLHLVGQCQHLLGGQDIQLHCISDREKRDRQLLLTYIQWMKLTDQIKYVQDMCWNSMQDMLSQLFLICNGGLRENVRCENRLA